MLEGECEHVVNVIFFMEIINFIFVGKATSSRSEESQV